MENVVCFGCGDFGRYFVEAYGSYLKIEYFLDNCFTSQKTFCGYDRFIPSKRKCENKFIIITNIKYYQEIACQLNDYGLEEERDFLSIGEFEKRNPTLRVGLKTIKCWFVDFWEGFNIYENVFVRSLRKDYNIVFDERNPDFLFCSVFVGKECKALQYQCTRIFYTGENLIPDFNIYDYAIGFDYIIYGDRYLRWPLYRLYPEFESIKEKHKKYDIDTFMKRNFCCRVVSNPNSIYREKLFEELNRRKYVASGGSCKNNLSNRQCVKDKIRFLSEYKFNLAIENSNTSGYVTEKIVQAWAAGCIPVYWGGSGTIMREFNKAAFVDCSDFATISDVADYLLELENDRDMLEEMLKAPALSKDFIPDDKLQLFLRNIVDRPEDKRIQRLSAMSEIARSQEQIYRNQI